MAQFQLATHAVSNEIRNTPMRRPVALGLANATPFSSPARTMANNLTRAFSARSSAVMLLRLIAGRNSEKDPKRVFPLK